MALPTATYTRYTAIGIKEDLSDVVSNISPMAFPFQTNAKRGKATNTFHEFMTDEIAAGEVNAHLEGDDSTAETATPAVRLGNYTMISKRVARVSGTNDAVDSAGNVTKMDYQVLKRSKQLKRDVETALLGTQAAVAGSAATARVLAGAACWMWTNQVAIGTAATTPTVTSGAPTTAPTAGTAGTFTEARLKSALKLCWDEGGDPTIVMVGSTNKQVASAFTGIATQYRDNPQKGPGVIIGAADVYVSDFSTVSIVANHFTSATNVYVFDMDYWSVDYLRPVQREPLAKTGDSMAEHVLAEYTLKCINPDASGKIYTTS